MANRRTLLDNQQQINKRLEKTFDHRIHTLDNPLITQDPYHITPLAALIQFTTEEPSMIKLTVHGKVPLEKTIPHYHTIHELPIIGLYADKNNRITVSATNHAGVTTSNTIHLKTDDVPDDFLAIDIEEADTEQMEKGLTFIVPSGHYLFAIDGEGEVRWYSSLEVRQLFKPLADGTFLIYADAGEDNNQKHILEMDLLGQVFQIYPVYDKADIPETAVNTEAIELSEDSLLMAIHEETEGSVEDKLVAMDRENGNRSSELRYRDVFPENVSEAGGDWLHNNSLWLDEGDGKVIMTGRHQDVVMKHRFPEGDVQWILASPENWPAGFEAYLLTPEGDDFKYPGGPHAVMTLPDQDGRSDTVDILLFDNNHVITRGDREMSDTFSRAVQYRIDEAAMTVREIWSYGAERGTAFFSPIVGDADLLPATNNRLITSGYIRSGDGRISKVIEVTGDEAAATVFEVTISGFASNGTQHVYRAARLEI